MSIELKTPIEGLTIINETGFDRDTQIRIGKNGKNIVDDLMVKKMTIEHEAGKWPVLKMECIIINGYKYFIPIDFISLNNLPECQA